MPIVMEIDGSSTVMTGSATGFSMSARVSPIVISGMPATAMMSPGPASCTGTRSSASVMRSSTTFARSTVPSAFIHATCWPLRIVPWCTRHSARRPRYGDASRLVTWACSGFAGSNCGGGHRRQKLAEERLEVLLLRHPAIGGPGQGRATGLGAGVDDGELDLLLGGVEVEEELVGLVDDLADPRVGTVDLVDDEHDREVLLQGLAQHEAGLRERALGRVDEEDDAVDHLEAALDLAAEVRVTGGVDDVERHAALGRRWPHVPDGGVLREDRDALLALEVHRVHDAVVDVLVGSEGPRLPQHGVDERRLPVVDVGDDGDVAQVFSGIHPMTLRGATLFPEIAKGWTMTDRIRTFRPAGPASCSGDVWLVVWTILWIRIAVRLHDLIMNLAAPGPAIASGRPDLATNIDSAGRVDRRAPPRRGRPRRALRRDERRGPVDRRRRADGGRCRGHAGDVPVRRSRDPRLRLLRGVLDPDPHRLRPAGHGCAAVRRRQRGPRPLRAARDGAAAPARARPHQRRPRRRVAARRAGVIHALASLELREEGLRPPALPAS